ncbi:NDP-hexose 2,3-dehydratase [Polynucleobacter paneuropaeus]|jgi:oxidase EvaA|nr:NDP-hexose 2,3-dehydratase [Polynucleobacter paneuropaeus]
MKETLFSAMSLVGVHDLGQIKTWVEDRLLKAEYKVEIAPLSKMRGWEICSNTGDIQHASGKFFSVSGLDASIEVDGELKSWTQPIVIQPEIGILGIISKKINGILHFLIQLKMEPGNIGFIQLSPTVQATRSNYTAVHGGRKPKYIEHFLDLSGSKVILDQLRSEQGARYYKKRNRNILIQLDESRQLDVEDGFIWVTLGQLQQLSAIPNLVHLDCRSILGAIPYVTSLNFDNKKHLFDIGNCHVQSLLCRDDLAYKKFPELLSWYTSIKFGIERETRLISLDIVKGWEFDGTSILNKSKKFFDVIGVNVSAKDREVSQWSQPLIRNVSGGIIGLLAQKHNGILHFLIQIRAEPGLIDVAELAPTVQFTPGNYESLETTFYPQFSHLFMSNEDGAKVIFDSSLSDEGGRFYRSEQRHAVIEIEEGVDVLHSKYYEWMTLSQLSRFAEMELSINIELRSILFCISLA